MQDAGDPCPHSRVADTSVASFGNRRADTAMSVTARAVEGGKTMNYRVLGGTGLRVSEVGLGAWAIGGGFTINGAGIGYGPTDDEVSKRAIARAIEVGINFIDTADAYGAGHSEELIGQVLGGKWEGCHVATKVGNERRDPLPGRKNFDRRYMMEACDRSLRRLRKDVIDLYQLHNPPPETGRQDEVFETLRMLRDQGKIRFIGVSVTTPEEGIDYIRRGVVDCLQIYYNIQTREAEIDLLPLCRAKKHRDARPCAALFGHSRGEIHARYGLPADGSEIELAHGADPRPRRRRGGRGETDRRANERGRGIAPVRPHPTGRNGGNPRSEDARAGRPECRRRQREGPRSRDRKGDPRHRRWRFRTADMNLEPPDCGVSPAERATHTRVRTIHG